MSMAFANYILQPLLESLSTCLLHTATEACVWGVRHTDGFGRVSKKFAFG